MGSKPKKRVCTGCNRNLAFTAEHFHCVAKSPHGLHTRCKQCVRAYQRAYDRKNPGRSRRRIYEGVYGITEEDYDRMNQEQRGRCAICGNDGSRSRGGRLAVDHCHESGAVRGLLCGPCNKGLGHFRDDPHLLDRAKSYLEHYLCAETVQDKTR